MNKPTSKTPPRYPEKVIQECLETLHSGGIDELFEIIPRIGVLRDRRFHGPLLSQLRHKDPKRREFAAYSMGAMRSQEFLEPLKKAFREALHVKGFCAEELQIAIIEAIGSIGDDAAVEFFLPMLTGSGVGGRGRKLHKRIVDSLGMIAQQGGSRSLEALLELTKHEDAELRAQALSELSVAYWHRPNEISDATLERICELTKDRNRMVAESALSALVSLADVGCESAEELFESNDETPGFAPE